MQNEPRLLPGRSLRRPLLPRVYADQNIDTHPQPHFAPGQDFNSPRYQDRNSDTNSQADRPTDRDPDENEDTNTNSYQHGDPAAHIEPHPEPDSDVFRDPDENEDANPNSHQHGYSTTHIEPHAEPDSDVFRDDDGHTQSGRKPSTVSVGNPDQRQLFPKPDADRHPRRTVPLRRRLRRQRYGERCRVGERSR